MFVLSRNVSASYRVIATLVATALLMWALGLHSYAQAANITDVYDLLTDTAPGADSNHTIQFLAPSGIAAGETIVVTFPAGFNLTGVGEDDVDLEVNGTDEDTAAAAAAAVWGVDITGQVLTIESGTDTIAGTATITIKVGTHATAFGTGANQINNPTPVDGNESYEIAISAGTSDSGYTRVVILDTVLVTANVETSFEFTVNPVPLGSTVNGETTTIGSSSTTIPFGTLEAGALNAEVIAQNLTVETNAINGFVVTVQSDGQLESSTGADIDGFENGTNTNVPTSWSGNPLDNIISDENTWGHWGVTTADQDSDGMRDGDEFASGEFIGVSTTPRAIFAHDGPADALEPSIGSTTVAYKVAITALQEAADDYEAVLTYIATPTF